MADQRCGTGIAMTAQQRDEFLRAQPLCRVGKHGWVRLVPEKIVSWDFSKLRR